MKPATILNALAPREDSRARVVAEVKRAGVRLDEAINASEAFVWARAITREEDALESIRGDGVRLYSAGLRAVRRQLEDLSDPGVA